MSILGKKASLKCSFPDQWRVEQIKMILKPDKNSELVESYRLISLLLLLSKVLEIIFLNRLTPIVQTNHHLSFANFRHFPSVR